MTPQERNKKRRRRLKRLGLCVDCGKEKRSKPHVLGEICLESHRRWWMEVGKIRHILFRPAVSKAQAEHEFLALTERS